MILDPIKTKLQLEVRDLWITSGAKSSVEWATGSGKSYLGILCIQEMLRRNPQRTTLIVVPTEQLKSQWEGHVKEHALSNCEVIIINTVIKNKYRVSLLLLDEYHRYFADTFKRIFDCVKYDFILGLTATLERNDGKHLILQEKCPIIHRITLNEAKVKGFVSDFKVYNLGIDFTEENRIQYNFIEDSFNKNFAIFGKDFELMRNCAFGKVVYDNIYDYSEEFITRTRINGKYESIRRDKNGKPYILVKWYKVFAKRTGVDEELVKNAAHVVWQKIAQRKEMLYFAQEKLTVGKAILLAYNVPSITFSERVDYIDTLTNLVGSNARSYHSKIPLKQRRQILQDFRDSKFLFLNTGKAVEEGMDLPDLELALTFSGTSIQRQFIQRTGRALRKQEDKVAKIINLYMKDTQDQAWCRQRTKGMNVQWINNLNEII